jgi:hypothetical protein
MTEITISDDLADRIDTQIQHTDFRDADEFAEFVLAEVVARLEHDAGAVSEATAPREEVEDRLQSLGYLDE